MLMQKFQNVRGFSACIPSQLFLVKCVLLRATMRARISASADAAFEFVLGSRPAVAPLIKL